MEVVTGKVHYPGTLLYYVRTGNDGFSGKNGQAPKVAAEEWVAK